MSFTSDLARFSDKVGRVMQEVTVEHATEMHRSITKGSQVTGAPGQPVQTGLLLNSWVLSFPAPFMAETLTNVVYAPVIEDGIGLTLQSGVGGFHSVALTRAANQRIADDAARKVVG